MHRGFKNDLESTPHRLFCIEEFLKELKLALCCFVNGNIKNDLKHILGGFVQGSFGNNLEPLPGYVLYRVVRVPTLGFVVQRRLGIIV